MVLSQQGWRLGRRDAGGLSKDGEERRSRVGRAGN